MESPPAYDDICSNVPLKSEEKERKTSGYLQDVENIAFKTEPTCGTLILRFTFEFIFRLMWTSFCFSWTMCSIVLFATMIVPPIGIPLSFLILYSWRCLAFVDLLINRVIIKNIYVEEGFSLPAQFRKMPRVGGIHSYSNSITANLFLLSSSPFTARSLIYMLLVQFTISLLNMIFTALLFALLFVPFTWLFLSNWRKAFNYLEKCVAITSFLCLAWDFEEIFTEH
eukprot:NODE_34_length_36538_cov_0.612854.p17 type:complete len:226 gc:universal NODE_34_length_36538_cov_0.612854:23808-23131(-)